ncbi:HAD family hydrolase [Paenibacillus darwinianus]|uniref:Acid sugar phosphatase n=1 Tax=Paenibacillus darwinianus TaxID=1380763 RepID=A0A9W5S1X4_9BACL|nr:TIGR01457 family HAD-type hydrolase [Paenibacillus darwinianus]EXX89856.1 HAD family hydrolase [Paenibacillus darwinianus]EXX90314.1 HAD family hydrolase [Paenibacillus darwinianus]EXX90698.1 HAD family hydrolase [Paenibacillus darwinianus]
MTHPKGLLIDLDGTLYHGDRMIDGADRLIALLRRLGRPYRFVTNNSSATPEAVAARLKRMGIPAVPEDVCTSAQAAAAYIAESKPDAQVFVIGEEGLLKAVSDAGLLRVEEQADFVLQGIDRQFTYLKAAQAVRLIQEGARFIMTNPDLLLPSDAGLIPGAGSIGAMLRAASGAEPVVIGKPSAVLMDFALKRLGRRASETIVVGDNLATDIAAGASAGCETALVLTGLTNNANYEALRAAAGVSPDRTHRDLHGLMAELSGAGG